MANQLLDDKDNQTTQPVDPNSLDSKRLDESSIAEAKPLTATSASSFGDLSYSVDVNPIVMSRAPDPLARFSGNQLKAQDKYYEEQEKKHRQSLQVLAMQTGIDESRQTHRKLERTAHDHAKSENLIQAILAGKDANQIVRQANSVSDKKRQLEHDRIKQQNQTDIEQQVTGVDINPRQQALDDQSDSVLDQITKTGSIDGRVIADGSANSDSGAELVKTTSSNADYSVDTGTDQKTVEGQDDNLLGLSDSQSANDNLFDPVDLLNDIQADFEITSADQTVVKQNNQMVPMINLNLRLGSIPTTIRDRYGFAVDLSKKDLAKIKAQLKKRFKKPMKWPVPIKTFNRLLAGNKQTSYVESQLSTTILKGHHVDFSKSISEAKPLTFEAPIKVVDAPLDEAGKTKEKIVDSTKAIQPDWESAKTPVDMALESRRLDRVNQLNQTSLADYERELKLKREDHSKQDLKLKQTTNQVEKKLEQDGPELN